MEMDSAIGEIINSPIVMARIISEKTIIGIGVPDEIKGMKQRKDAPVTNTAIANLRGVLGCLRPIFVQIAAITPENRTTHMLCMESFHETGTVNEPMVRLTVSSK